MSGATPSHPSLSTATSEVPSHATQSVTNQTMPVAGEAHPAHPNLPTTSAAEAPHLTSPVLPQTLQASDLPTTSPAISEARYLPHDQPSTQSATILNIDHVLTSLPAQWHLYRDSSDTLQFCKVQRDGIDSLCTVTKSVVLDVVKSSWSVYVRGKRVPETCKALSKFPGTVSSNLLQDIICTVDKSSVCPGNPDEKFVQLYRQATYHYSGTSDKRTSCSCPLLRGLKMFSFFQSVFCWKFHCISRTRMQILLKLGTVLITIY